MARPKKDEEREERIQTEIIVDAYELEGVKVDEETQQAIEDWHYWVKQGNSFNDM